MTARSIPARVYIGPTKAATTGTVVLNIQDDTVQWEDGRKTKAVGGGLEPDAWDTVEDFENSPPSLSFSLRDVSAQTIDLLFGFTTAGTSKLHSDKNDTPAEFTLAVRPDGSDNILYGPRWKLHPDSVAILQWARDMSAYEDTEVILIPQRSTDGTKRATMLDTASAIDTYYGL